MRVPVLTFLIGAALGAAAVWVLAGGPGMPAAGEMGATQRPSTRAGPTPAAEAARGARRGADPQDLPSLIAAPLGTEGRAALYAAAARADASGVRSMLRSIESLPAGAPRTFALEVLFARYAELDPSGAMAEAQRMQLPPSAFKSLYRAWAVREPSAAIAALQDVSDHTLARQAAVAMLDVLGNDDLNLARVAAVFPPAAADQLWVDALGAQASSEPRAAFDRAAALTDPYLRGLAVERVAGIWAERDPRSAYAAADSLLDVEPRERARAAVLGVWAVRAPEEMLAHVSDRDLGAGRQILTGALQRLAGADPERALALAERFEPEARTLVEAAALQALVRRDPAAALARLDRMAPGMHRQQLVQFLGGAYGERDPDAALAWVESLPAAERAMAYTAVVGGIARIDFERGLELALAADDSRGMTGQALMRVVMNGVARATADTAAVAERVLALRDEGTRSMALQNLASIWASRAPSDAMEWILANSERLPPQIFATVIDRVGRSIGVSSLLGYTSRVPSDARGAWVAGVARIYALSDPVQAIQWVEQFRGDPLYPSAVAGVLQQAAQHDPLAAQRLFATLDPASAQARSAAPAVASALMRDNRARAASWALDVADDEARQRAVQAVARLWVNADAPDARAWVLGLPQGPTRDAALGPIVTAMAARGDPDQSLLGAFGSDAARTQALRGAVMAIAQRSPADARRFADLHLTDPAARQQVEQMIDNVQSGRVTMMGF